MTRTTAPRPLIGVTKPDKGDLAAFWAAGLALRLGGARVVAITARTPRLDMALDGLLLGGGSDIHPVRFEVPPKTGYAYDLSREDMEVEWLRLAHAGDLPTLGVCRGAQLMNVAAGGALHMDLAETFGDTRYPTHWLEQAWFRKRVRIEPGSRLAGIVGEAELWVNSVHRQAVERLGAGLTISARETNGAVQAIEDSSRRFWLGVQFHPEFLIYRRRFRAIFREFVAAAARHALARLSVNRPGA